MPGSLMRVQSMRKILTAAEPDIIVRGSENFTLLVVARDRRVLRRRQLRSIFA
ncbi:MAG: hypothetical protein HW394_1191 [Acidobacteria bacterium]|nr:hypothetical protein [Acidobacteriota bacterium]